MDEYQLFYKDHLKPTGSLDRGWTVFLCALNQSPRAAHIRRAVVAARKICLILPEYGYSPGDSPSDCECVPMERSDESLVDFVLARAADLRAASLVIDISSMVNHYVLALFNALCSVGVEECDVLYGEPSRYVRNEQTEFSDGRVIDVRQVVGFEGAHTIDTNHDLLIIGVGYDSRVVEEVANHKENARKLQLFGLPSLQPDMYQESMLRAAQVADAIGHEAGHQSHFLFAPANDPFVTAGTLSTAVRRHLQQYPHSNVYLSPLSTKAQALGFVVYYLRECRGKPVSVIYPYCRAYVPETSEEISGVWCYHLELANLVREGVIRL